ncbi:MAG: MlaE family ABC transporter permease [Planctomycetota bacterium]
MARTSAKTNSGKAFVAAGHAILGGLLGAGHTIVLTLRSGRHARRCWVRRRQILSQMLICGVYSIPVAMLVAAFTGMVIALQVGIELERWGQAHRIGALVAASMCRELGPVWVGVILAARIGSAMAAELGTMRVSEEVDALEVMSIDPAEFLVMPRLVALTLMAPILTVYADLIGIVGGAIVGRYQLGVSFHTYFRLARQMLTNKDILSGILIKAPIFGLLIASVGCSLGLSVDPSEGAEGVGRATRSSVVTALIFLIVFNYLLTSGIRHL